MPRSAARLPAGPAGSPAAAIPDTSPFTSATTTGTPCADSCSAITCNVLVLPVPVAPATSPCRLTIASGTCTTAPAATFPSYTPRPRSTTGPSTSYASAIVFSKSVMSPPQSQLGQPVDALDAFVYGIARERQLRHPWRQV